MKKIFKALCLIIGVTMIIVMAVYFHEDKINEAVLSGVIALIYYRLFSIVDN